MKTILFVCTGNTCRSSMAEGILGDLIAKDPKLTGKLAVASAGVAAFDGEPASEKSVRVLKDEWDIDISSHASRYITSKIVQNADLILTMTVNHKEDVLSSFPESKGKVFTLKEYVSGDEIEYEPGRFNGPLDIIDPYGMSLSAYKRCADEIKNNVEALVQKLKSDENFF